MSGIFTTSLLEALFELSNVQFRAIFRHAKVALILLTGYVCDCVAICDTSKGNESLVENFNFYFFTPLSQNLEMHHFNANPITIGYLVTEL